MRDEPSVCVKDIIVDGQDLVKVTMYRGKQFRMALFLDPDEAGALADALCGWAVDHEIAEAIEREGA